MLTTVTWYLTIFRVYLGKSQFINVAELQLFTFSKYINSDTVPHITRVVNSCVRNCSTILLCFNPLNAELNPICYLQALLAQNFLHVSRIRFKSLTLRLLMAYIYIYMERIFLMFLDHTQRRSTVGRTPLDE